MAEETFSQGSLKTLIQLNYKEKKTVYPLKKGDCIRSSGFASLCPREEVLAALYNIIRSEEFDANSLLTFSLGTDFHSRLQDEILPRIGVMFGAWKCNNCSKVFGGMGKKKGFDFDAMITKPVKCTKCHSSDFRYQEHSFKDTEHGISGHPDGFIVIPGRDGPGVIEAKSIGAKGAAEIRKCPKFEHVIQAQLYLMFTGFKWSVLLYWDKSSYGLNALTEHFIDRDEDTISLINETLQSVWSGLDGGPLPERICGTIEAPRAKTCACASKCFMKEG